MSYIEIKDASNATRKIKSFPRTEGADTVETQGNAVVDPITGDPIEFATETTLAALLSAANAIKAAAEALNTKATAINTGAIAGTVELGATSLAALETVTVGGSVSVSNMVELGITDTQLRASPVPISSAASYAEDTPHVSGDIGNLMLAIRSDSDTPTANDGDYTILKMDEEGRLKVASKPASYADITGNITAVQAVISTPVAGGTVSGDVSRASNVMAFCTGTFAGVNVTFEGSLESTGDANWFGIQAVRTNSNTIETATGALGAQPVYGWEMSVNALARVRVRCTALTSGTQAWRFKLGTYATEPIPAAQVTATQPVSGSVTASGTVTANQGTLTAPTANILNSAATTNGTVVKGSAGTIYGFKVSNNGAGVAYFKLHNSATVTVGTTAVADWTPIPAGGSVNISYGAPGQRYVTGICFSITGGIADTDTTAVAAGQVKVNLSYI